ncbi:MAG: ABC transporter ATP-binding protein [Desulfobacterales bacterium]|nr:ABC transporter ATP-binding protein [Desulfobacterales bacterium]
MTILELKSLEIYYDRIKIIDGISLSMQEGDFVAMLGSNGAGKSTLLQVISGILFCDFGHIKFYDRRIENMDPNRIVKLGITQVPEARRVFPELSVKENLWMGGFALRNKKKLKQNMDHAFEMFPQISKKQHSKAKFLSGGEQQMLAIGRALMSEPKLLLLDEPSMGLSPLLTSEIFTTIKKVNNEGVSIFMVEQNARKALEIATYGYVLVKGRIDKHGEATSLKEDEEIREAYLGDGRYIDRKNLWRGKASLKK